MLILAISATASADSFSTARGQAMEEARHQAWLTIDDGVARYRVEREFANAGERADEARLDLSMPVGGAAVGLRIKVGQDWLEGELMRADRAAELYRELTGFGPHAPKDPALLAWRWASDLTLQVFPVPSGGRSNVGYSLVAPTTYRDGRYYVTYPRIPKGDGLAVSAIQIDDLGAPMIDGRPVSPGELHPLVAEDEDGGKPAWMGDHDPSPTATYVKSDIAIAQQDQAVAAAIDVDLQHTYRGDITLELVTPSGTWHPLVASQGGSENDVRERFEVTFDSPVPTEGTWRLVVSDHARLDTGTLKSWSLSMRTPQSRTVAGTAADTPVFVPDAPQSGHDGQATISVEAPPIDTVAARLGSVPAAADKAFFRLEIDTAPQLRPLPEKLSAVFVVDASRSLPSEGLAPQLALIRSFLSHVPDASFEIVATRRRAERVIGRFASAGEVDAVLAAALESGKLELGNGSHLDAALAEAGDALRTRRGPRTIVVMTDALLRPSWQNASALTALKRAPGTTVHVVLPTAGSRVAEDRRDDDHALAPIATRGGGILLHVEQIDGRTKPLDAISLGLVRPIRIDGFQLEGVRLPDGASLPDRLEEGDGLREMHMLAKAPTRVRLRGKIWARPFVREVTATLPFSKATAAFVFSHDMHDPLSAEEQFRLAMTAGAVSPQTSYLAIEPGVRPSTIGLEGIGRGFGSGAGGMGRSHRARPPRIRAAASFDLRGAIAEQIAACEKAHQPPADWEVDLDLHLTFEEIVDIDAPAEPMAQCLAEAAWTVALPVDEFLHQRDVFHVTLSRR